MRQMKHPMHQVLIRLNTLPSVHFIFYMQMSKTYSERQTGRQTQRHTQIHTERDT